MPGVIIGYITVIGAGSVFQETSFICRCCWKSL
nr:hypothetical protein [uncultured Clostridium sp.]